MLTLAQLQQSVHSLQGGLGLLLNPQGQVLALNPLASKVFAISSPPSTPVELSVLLGLDPKEHSQPATSPFTDFFQRFCQDRLFDFDQQLWTWSYSAIENQTQTYYLLLGAALPSKLQGDAEQKLFRNIINNIPQYIFWKNRESVFLGCNNNFARLVGLDHPEQIIGKTDYDFPWSSEQTALYRQDDQNVMRNRVPKLYYEEQQTDTSGVVHDVLVSKIPLYADDTRQDVIGLVCIYQDITEKKRLEKALLQAKVRAEAANRAKSEFIANMSHDIRTPITGMLGLAQFLKDRAHNPESLECAQLLIDSTEELLKLLNEVIEIIHLESATQAPQAERFYLPDIIMHNMTLLAPAAKHKGLAFEYLIAPQTPNWLYGPRTYLDRILLNVISNAVKFTQQGGVEVKVSTHPRSTTGVELVLEVRDTGIGIPANRQQDIFDRYSRVTPSYDGIYKGSGIGLYVVKKYLDEIDGTVEVQSSINQGSCFTLRIPFELGDDQQKPVPVPESKLASSSPAESLLNVLVIEDNPLAARMAIQLLQKQGCRCLHAASAQEALTQLAAATVDLIMLDIGLPDQNGYELAAKIRAMPAFQNTPIVALTGHLGEKQKVQCLAAGMQEVVTKPISAGVAQALLQRWVGQQPRVEADGSVNLQEGAALSGGNEAAAKQLIDMLVAALPDTLARVEAFYAAGQWKALSDEIHKLYGGLCYVGVPTLRAIVKQLDQALQASTSNNELAEPIQAFLAEAKRIIAAWRR